MKEHFVSKVAQIALVTSLILPLGCGSEPEADPEASATGAGGAGGEDGIGGSGGAGGEGGTGGGEGGAGGEGGIGGSGGAGGEGGAGGGEPPALLGEALWGRGAGDAKNDRVEAIATDQDENIVLVGGFETAVNFGGEADGLVSAGQHDIFVVKLDAEGNHLWSKRYGDARDQYALAVATDASGNIVVAGEFAGTLNFGTDPSSELTSAGLKDIFVAKLDAEGNHLWSKRYGDARDQYATAVAVTGEGDIVVLGHADGSINFGEDPGTAMTSAGGLNVVLAKLDADGNHLWSRRFGAESSWQRFRGLVVTDSAIYAAGAFGGQLEIDGHAVESAVDRVISGAGGAGGDGGAGAGEPVYGTDALVVRFDPGTGGLVWARPLGAAGEQYAKLIGLGIDGNPVIVGNYRAAFQIGGVEIPHAGTGGYHLYLAQLDAEAGEPLAARGFPSEGDQFAWGFSQDPWGNHVVSGYFTRSLSLGGAPIAIEAPSTADAFVTKLSPDFSEALWTDVYRDQFYSFISAQAVTASGNTIAAGLFYGERLDLGGGLPLIEHSAPARDSKNGDVFLVAISP